jgi:hypothetical protein
MTHLTRLILMCPKDQESEFMGLDQKLFDRG